MITVFALFSCLVTPGYAGAQCTRMEREVYRDIAACDRRLDGITGATGSAKEALKTANPHFVCLQTTVPTWTVPAR